MRAGRSLLLSRARVFGFAGLLIVTSGTACGEKKQEDKPPAEKSGGLETSWTGYVSKTYSGNLEPCVTAAKAALQRLHVSVKEESGGIFRKTLDGEGSDGTTVTVKISELTKTTTRISVKVGYIYGDADAAQRIHSEVDAELGTRRATGSKWGGFSSFGDALGPTPAPGGAPGPPGTR